MVPEKLPIEQPTQSLKASVGMQTQIIFLYHFTRGKASCLPLVVGIHRVNIYEGVPRLSLHIPLEVQPPPPPTPLRKLLLLISLEGHTFI